MSTTPAEGMRELRRLSGAMQEARVSRRAMLKGAATAAAAGLAAPATRAAPSSIPVGDLVLAQGIIAGACLVTSHRLPLQGIASNLAAPLLQGDITNWSELGAGLSLPVTVLVVDGKLPEGVNPAETVADYPALVAKLDEIPGGVAMIPIDMVDSQVNVLEFDGISPLLASGTDAEPITKLGVAGDIIFGRNGGNYQRKFAEPTIPMWQVKDFMSTFDVTVCNFECFVSETLDLPELTQTNPLDFVTRPDSLEGMVMSGIDSVTMANNHAVYPFGEDAMNDTIGFLNEAGIDAWGVGSDLDQARAPWTTEVNGVSFAFYGIDAVTANVDYPGSWSLPSDSAATASKGGTNPLVMDNILPDIEALAGQYDVVIPYMHAGEQYLWTPREWLVDVCRQFVDAGASVVLTSHPHATMGMEIYKGKPIFYSIGNFVYDQMFSLETREGYFIDFTFRGKTLVGFRIHPTECVDFVQPRFLSPLESVGFNDRFWRSIDLTRALLGDWVTS